MEELDDVLEEESSFLRYNKASSKRKGYSESSESIHDIEREYFESVAHEDSQDSFLLSRFSDANKRHKTASKNWKHEEDAGGDIDNVEGYLKNLHEKISGSTKKRCSTSSFKGLPRKKIKSAEDLLYDEEDIDSNIVAAELDSLDVVDDGVDAYLEHDAIFSRKKVYAKKIDPKNKKDSVVTYKPALDYDFTKFRNRPLIPRNTIQTNDRQFKFFATGAEWRYDKRKGTCIHFYGNMWETNHSAVCIITGFKPHMYVSIPPDWYTITEDGERHLQEDTIASFVQNLDIILRTKYPWSKWDKEKIDNMGRLISEHKIVDAIDMENYLARDKLKPTRDDGLPNIIKNVDKYINISCVFPRAISAIRYIVDNAKLYEWNFTYVNNGQTKNKMYVYEADVDFTVRFVTDMHFSPSEWYTVAPYKYSVHQRDTWGRSSNADWEIVCNYKDLKPTENPKDNDTLCDWQICTFDGEMMGVGHFPRAADGDPIVLIAICQTSYFKRDQPTFILISYGLDNEYRYDKDSNTHTYIFKEEKDIMKAWYDYVKQVDIDIFQTYNGDNFDWDYFLTRGVAHFGEDYKILGRNLWNKTYVKKTPWRGVTKYSVGIAGRINVDLYKRVKGDFIPGVKFADFRLSTVSRALFNDTKNEFNVLLIPMKIRDENGLNEMREYGKKDSVLPDKISVRINTVPTYVGLSRVTNVFFQQCIDRALGAKIEGRLRKICFLDEAQPTIKRNKEIVDKTGRGPGWRGEDGDDPLADMVDKCLKKLKGAQVIKPIIGDHSYPVAVVDFASMYPSIMMLLNLCLTTVVTPKVIRKLGLTPDHYFQLPKYVYANDPVTGLPTITLEHDPEAPCFIKRELLEGVLPAVEKELGNMRGTVKKGLGAAKDAIAKYKEQIKVLTEMMDTPEVASDIKKQHEYHDQIKVLKKMIVDKEFEIVLLDGQQLGIKVWMNGIFGQTIFPSSKYYREEIGKTILNFGRFLINYVMLYVNQEFPKKFTDLNNLPDIEKEFREALSEREFSDFIKEYEAELREIIEDSKSGLPFRPIVIYGDTDSCMIKEEGFVGTMRKALVWFMFMAININRCFDACKPLDMQLEKMYDGFVMISGKNYIGCKVWAEGRWLKQQIKENVDGVMKEVWYNGVIETKGLRYTKKGPPQIFKKLCGDMALTYLVKKDLEGALKMVRDMVINLRKRNVTVSDLVYTHTFNKDPSYVLWKYCEQLKQKKVKIPPATLKVINENYKKSSDFKRKKKINAQVNASVIHCYKMLCNDPGRWYERGDSLFYLFYDEEKMRNKSGRGFAKQELRELTIDPLVMMTHDIPYHVEKYTEDLMKLSQKIVAFKCGDTEVKDCPHYRKRVFEHEDVTKVQIKKHKPFSSQVVGSTHVKKIVDHGNIRKHFAPIVNTVCIMCQKKLNENDARFIINEGKKCICEPCTNSMDLTVYQTLLEKKLEQAKELDDKNWNQCKKCLNSDNLDPMECVDITCHYNSARIDTQKKKRKAEALLKRLTQFRQDVIRRKLGDKIDEIL